MTGSSRPPAEKQPERERLSERARHRILTSDRRRLALDVLANRSEPIHLEDLAGEVATREEGQAGADGERTERLTLQLHHRHLPMLDEFGVVNYDPHENRVEPRRGLPEALTD